MKTAIGIGNAVIVSGDNEVFLGVVKATHLFTYSVLYSYKYYDEDEGTEEEGFAISRIPKWRCYWHSDNDKVVLRDA